MAGLAFDTLAYARRMEAVGFSREQAEALAEEQAKLLDERLATKLDLEVLRENLRAAVGKDIAEARADILKWMIGTIGLQTVVIIGAVVALVRALPH